MKILAIESSCDETAAAVIEERAGKPLLLSNVVSSQIDIHKAYGGVVPEVAARAHIENVIPVVDEALKEAGTNLAELNYIGVTYGPGLVGSLVVGVETAKALGVAKNIPVIPINHLEGHVYANFLGAEPEFPLVALLVSGGHTMLIHMKNHFEYEVIGHTKDDAAGEAFDKGAKILELGYPGGPIISKVAEKGNENKIKFPLVDLTPEPQRNKEGFLEQPEPSMDFSFSGLKTALINKVRGGEDYKKEDLAASFQKAIIDNLVQNSLRAVKKYKPKTFILSGGVAANELLRDTLKKRISECSPNTKYLIPEKLLCTDNAAMIASVAYWRIKTGNAETTLDFAAEPNLEIK